MTPKSSLFLDAARFAAALVVMLSHLTSHGVNAVFPWVRWAHEAVVVFFVISGYVIGYVADTRENTAADFAASRLGRLYSVMLPALALTFVLDAAGIAVAPELYVATDHQQPALRLLINLLFLQQSWNATVVPLSNGPFWSLAYEFWYYVIFAAWHFTHGKARIAWVALALLCAGPRIVAYFPLWLTGLLAYRASRRWHLPRAIARMTFAASALAFFLLLRFGNPLDWVRHAASAIFPDRHVVLAGIPLFLGDTPRLPADLLVASLFAAMVFSIQGPLPAIAWQARGAALVHYLAGSTFSLYLFHIPILYFLVAVLDIHNTSASGLILAGLLTVTACLALSHLFERRVAAYRRFFKSGLTLFAAGGHHHKSLH